MVGYTLLTEYLSVRLLISMAQHLPL